jgi:hypothetical protein
MDIRGTSHMCCAGASAARGAVGVGRVSGGTGTEAAQGGREELLASFVSSHIIRQYTVYLIVLA